VATWRDEAVWLEFVAGRVLVLLNRRRLNLSDLSRLSGIPYCTLYGYIRQSRRIPAFALWRMARALNVELSELAGSAGPANPHTDATFQTSENSNFQKLMQRLILSVVSGESVRIRRVSRRW
jgi:transcriptional regulator with XRE-family HTH domain